MLAKFVCFAAVVMGSIAPVVRAQQSAYGQCGGIGWTGATTCVSGYTCVYSNDYYSQCVPGTASVASATKTSSTIKTSSTSTKAASSTATVYLAGDSTMAKGGAGDGDTDGWGQYLSKYITLAVVNDAVGGRSARSYTREGRFTTIINTVKSGDYVVIEFGHNDGGSLTPTDNGRTDCPGAGSETCQTTYDGVAETVLTFPAYLINAANSLKAKGANVIISSQTPDNPWETGTFSCTANRFQTYAQSAASTSGSSYTDHWTTTCNVYQHLGATVVDSYYPNDHTHTSPTGADVVAQAFVRGLLCSSSTLKSYVNTAGNAVYGSC